MKRIILASKSPRRQELMRFICDDFVTASPRALEDIPQNLQHYGAAELLAERKAMAVFPSYPHDIVIGADTIVVLDDEIIGKPTNQDDAERILMKLSGKTHDVYTGVCLMAWKYKSVFYNKTEVTFYPLDGDEIKQYVKTKEPMDKAGAYGIQGMGALFVERIHGDYYSVMGLPVAQLNKELIKLRKKIQ